MKVDPRRARPLTTSGEQPSKPKPKTTGPTGAAPSSFTPARAKRKAWTHPGLAEFQPEPQRFMKALATGKTAMAVRFRAELEKPEVKAKPPKDQLLAALTAAVPWTVAPEPRTTVVSPPEHSIATPRHVDAWPFHGSTAPAEITDVTIGGHTISIALPSAGTDGGRPQHSVDDVVKTLLALPAVSRAQISSVQLNPVSNPDDAYWDQVYGTTGTKSYMTCGSEGQVTIYPMDDGQPLFPLDSMRSSMVHETGHAWSMRRWGEDSTGPKWAEWRDATVKDGVAVSSYGQSDVMEDLAEAGTLYLESKGTPSFAEYRKLYPARFAILDRELGGTP